ncbi:MAG: ISAs1 family transposase [Spirulina sp. SIO3F2]|nr:ISAs1 family transposase [Spirulina sp. SIO3F2]
MSKKTVERIVNQGQHYLIALKANQKTLYQTTQQLHHQGQSLDQVMEEDNSHGRQAYRRVSVYAAPPECQAQWAGLTCLIWVERWGIRDGKSYSESVGYITNLHLSAKEFLGAIQRHWHIENRLHWVRDVLFEEDFSRPGGNAPILWAILNCWLLNLVRKLGFRTVPQGLRRLANQVELVWTILTHGFSSAK